MQLMRCTMYFCLMCFSSEELPLMPLLRQHAMLPTHASAVQAHAFYKLQVTSSSNCCCGTSCSHPPISNPIIKTSRSEEIIIFKSGYAAAGYVAFILPAALNDGFEHIISCDLLFHKVKWFWALLFLEVEYKWMCMMISGTE